MRTAPSILSRLCVAVTALIAVTQVPAAFAAQMSVDTSGLALPAGVTIASVTPQYNAELDTTSVCVTFDYSGAPTYLFFHDLQINGSSMVGDYFEGRQIAAVPSNTGNGSRLCPVVGFGDLSSTSAAVTLTSTLAQTRLSAQSTLEFPVSFTEISTKLAALGVTVTNAYMAWSASPDGIASYEFYVEATPAKQGTSVMVTWTNPRLTYGNSGIVRLSGGDQYPRISGPTEFNLGGTTQDPMEGLGTVQVKADFVKAVPSTFAVSTKLPTGWSITADPAQWYYDSQANRTYVGDIFMRNGSKSAISVSLTGGVLSTVKSGKATSLKLKTLPVQYLTVPAKSSKVVNLFEAGAVGDIRYNRALSLSVTVERASPSTLNLKGLTLPKGFTAQPLSFDTMFYDASAKQTWLAVELTQPTASAAKILVPSGLKVAGAAQASALTAGTVDGATRSYFLDLGLTKGDVRSGKTIVVTGKVTTATPTTYSHTAVVGDSRTGIEVLVAPSAEHWTYDAKTKQTQITVLLTHNGDWETFVNTCGVTVTVDGNVVSNPLSSKEIWPGMNVWLPVATVTGDVRTGGHTITVSGTYGTNGCQQQPTLARSR